MNHKNETPGICNYPGCGIKHGRGKTALYCWKHAKDVENEKRNLRVKNARKAKAKNAPTVHK